MQYIPRPINLDKNLDSSLGLGSSHMSLMVW